MDPSCRIFNTIEHIKAASYVNVAYLGGSLTAAAGAGNTAVTSWRRLFTRYLYEHYHPVYHCQPSEVMGAVGAMESYGAAFTLERNVTPNLPVLAFVEFCVNDRAAADKDLVIKGLEGIIRQLRSCRTRPDVVFLGAGCRPGTGSGPGGLVDHGVHREVAAHYGAPFLDVQDFILRALAARGQDWNAVSIVFEENDPVHLNDYGNRLWFECLRDWFEAQWRLHDANPTRRPDAVLPAPLRSDELQFARLVNPAKPSPALELEGGWERKDPGLVPWYLDGLLVGRPGDRLRFRFTGTAIGTICLVHPNGLKLEARLDGRELPGPFTNFSIEFGKFSMLAHGLPEAGHELELTVGRPMSRRNRLPDPTAQVGALAVAGRAR